MSVAFTAPPVFHHLHRPRPRPPRPPGWGGVRGAGLGLYGTFAFYVRQRQREIGIRMALGAEARRVERLVLRQGVVRLAVGIVLGLVGAVLAARWIAGDLAGVTPTDPVALLVAPAVLATVALVATWLPAMRAARIDPAAVLRGE